MVAFPVDTPVTTPDAFTVAIAGAALLQLPRGEPLLVSVMADPIHTVEAPLTVPALRTGLTVMLADAVAVPQGVVDV